MKKISLKISLLTLTLLIIFFINYQSSQENSQALNQNQVLKYTPMIRAGEILFIAYFDDESKTPYENRDIKGLNKDNASKFFEIKKDDYNFLVIERLEGLEETFLLKLNYFDHGDYVTKYGLVYDPKNDKILYETVDLFTSPYHRFGSIKQVNQTEVRVCYQNYLLPKDPDNRDFVCETLSLVKN